MTPGGDTRPPTTARLAARRPAQAAYREHVLYHCRALRDNQCQTCLDLEREAIAEAWRLFGSWRPERALAAPEAGA